MTRRSGESHHSRVPQGAAEWITTLERALTAARRRNVEARALLEVLFQFVSDEHLRERMRSWLDMKGQLVVPPESREWRGRQTIPRTDGPYTCGECGTELIYENEPCPTCAR
jgi:hypothetical protein